MRANTDANKSRFILVTTPQTYNYYDDWEKLLFLCPRCGWIGKFEDGNVTDTADGSRCSCPRCDFFRSPTLATVLDPTLDEMRANIDKPGVREELERWERAIAWFEERKLKTPDQLPDIDDPEFVLTWDFDQDDQKKSWTIIKNGQQEIFREPARWEGYPRYETVAKILVEKYGKRLKDLVPTSDSEMYLWGDRLSAPQWIQAKRKEIFGVDAPLWQ